MTEDHAADTIAGLDTATAQAAEMLEKIDAAALAVDRDDEVLTKADALTAIATCRNVLITALGLVSKFRATAEQADQLLRQAQELVQINQALAQQVAEAHSLLDEALALRPPPERRN